MSSLKSQLLLEEDEKRKWRVGFIRDSIINFINCNCQQKDIVTLDEIILDYVVGVLEDMLITESDFDLSEFSEMLSAYFPNFESIDQSLVLQWVHELLKGIKHKDQVVNSNKDELFFGCLMADGGGSGGHNQGQNQGQRARSGTESSSSDEDFLLLKEQQLQQRSRMCSESSSSSSSKSSNSSSLETQEKLDLLTEMFPNLTIKEATGVLNLASYEMERAVQIVLLQIEDNLVVRNKQADLNVNVGKDVKVLKDNIVKRYGFIDQALDDKEFRPIMPKEEPKKLVRYREGQVVSTKGERYTEVAVNANGEETKIKTYIYKSQNKH